MTRFLLGAVAVGIAVLVVIFNFSAKETRFECTGTLNAGGNPDQRTIYIKLNEYRPWVHLWTDADGDLTFEVPNQFYGYYTPIRITGDHLRIFDGENIAGNFSRLSKAIMLKVHTGYFEGTCN